MPQPRLHASQAARQAAYRQRQAEARRKELEVRGLPPLPAIATLPGNVRWRQATSEAACLLMCVATEMQVYFNERSDEWQESERGETHQERTDAIEEIAGALEAFWT